MLLNLCQRHTTLSRSDIRKLKDFSVSLGNIAEMMGADIFIDCGTRDPDVAIVVAQARPSNANSLYESSVVGQLACRSNEPAVLRTLEIGLPTRDMRGITQENKNVRQSVSPIKNDSGAVIGVLIAEKDVTASVKEKRNMKALAQTTSILMEELTNCRGGDNSLPSQVNDGILMFNSRGICIYANPVGVGIYRKLGYLDKIVGLDYSNLNIDGTSLSDILGSKHSIHDDVKVGSLSLKIKYTLANQNDSTGVAMILSDVTDMCIKEKELILKTVAISEIHHRVKNNLQTIASFLKLQSRRIDNEEVRLLFNESISRVLSIAATHEILAEGGVDDIDIMTMLKKIKSSIIGHGLAGSKAISITIRGDTFICNSDRATAIALVMNEAIQNSLKYAFIDRDEGMIAIEICNGTMYSNISIIDNGAGFDPDNERAGNLGFTIIRRLVAEKLGGNLTVESSESGTRILFDFPRNQY